MDFEEHVENKIPDLNGLESFCGLIGGERPSTYSKSDKMWNAVFKKFGISAVYVPFDVPTGKLREFVGTVKKESNFRGCNVTVPYKKDVIELLEDVDSQAKEYSAVNTLLRTGSGLKGYNTDGLGEVGNLKSLVGDLKGKRILQIGAGGAGNAISYALVQEGAELIISNRTIQKAEDLSSRLQKFYGLKNAPKFGGESLVPDHAGEVDIILNVSLKGQQGSPFENHSALAPTTEKNKENSLEISKSVPKETVFADIIYKPDESIFLKHGRETGHRTLNGSMMLVYQAVRACEMLYEKELKESDATTEEITKIMRSQVLDKS